MDEAAIRLAIHTWLAASSGVEVRLADQEWPAPATGQAPLPWGTYRLGDAQDIPIRPARRTEYVPGQPNGQELLATISMPKRLAVQVQFTTPSATQAVGGIPWAKPLLEKVVGELELDIYRTPLHQAGLGLIRKGPVRDISAIAGTRWQGRAVVDLQFRVVASATQKQGYIEEVELELSTS